MPEPRDRLVRVVTAVDTPLGREIRRGPYQDMLREAVFGPSSRRSFQVQSASGRARRPAVGNENILAGRASPVQRQGGSPLPAWHPRTPLRDITAVVNAMERRRSSMRIASRRRGHQTLEASPPPASEINPSPPASGTAPAVLDTDNSPPEAATGVPAIESSPVTPRDLTIITAADNPELVEIEARLEKSIDVIEKAVKGNLKRTLKMDTGKPNQRRTLLSLR